MECHPSIHYLCVLLRIQDHSVLLEHISAVFWRKVHPWIGYQSIKWVIYFFLI